jgi:hypothetical protein
MTLSLGDIETWDEAAIEQVFSAATFRAEGAQTTGDTVGDLLSFVTWHGATADAARDSANRIKLTLSNHAEECKRVAAAAHKASAEVADLKYRLSSIKAEASKVQLNINEQTGAVTSNATVLTVAMQKQQDAVKADVEIRIRQLIADADGVDRDLANAIQTADGASPGPTPAGGPAPNLPTPPRATAKPDEVKKWWDGLSPQQQTDYIAHDPGAIDRDGIPPDIRDAGNRIRLPHEVAVAESTLHDAKNRESKYWEQVNTNPASIESLGDPPGDLVRAQSRLNDLLGIHSALYPTNSGGSPRAIDPKDRRSLILLDTASNPRHVFGAIGIGDVENASHVGVTTGGVGTNASSLPGMADEATNLRHTTRDILTWSHDPNRESVATVAWVGYEPPAGMDDLRVTNDGLAKAAAPHLTSFFNGLGATTENPNQQMTAFGHSYGSLVTSLALQGGTPVKDVVFYGSPGLELPHASDLHLAPGGHAYYEQTPDDPIRGVQHPLSLIPYVGPALDWLATGGFPTDMPFAATPDEMPGITQLSTSAGTDPLHVDRLGSSGHSEYPRDDGMGRQQLRMSGYNLAAVLSGVSGAPKEGR